MRFLLTAGCNQRTAFALYPARGNGGEIVRKTTEGLVVLVLLTASARGAVADPPELSSWLLNTTGLTG